MIQRSYEPSVSLPEDVRLLLAFGQEAVRAAGELARSLQRTATASLKADHTPVTTADLAVQGLLETRIRERFPSHQLLGEEALEGASPRPLDPACPTWVIDPIDGTDSFRRRLPSWTISLGYLERGVPMLGWVFHPVSGELFWAIRDVGAFCNDERLSIRADLPLSRESMLLMTSTSHRYVVNDFPGALRLYGCVSAHLCFVAAGRVDAAVLAGAWIWDIVAGGLLVECAGGGLFEVSGAPLDWASLYRRPGRAPILLAGHPSLVRPVLTTLQPREPRHTRE